jgi:hypothetical protein
MPWHNWFTGYSLIVIRNQTNCSIWTTIVRSLLLHFVHFSHEVRYCFFQAVYPHLQYYFSVVPEPDEMVSDEQQSSPVCCFNLSISLTRFATVFPGGLSSLSFTWLKLSVIVLVLRCDHRVVVTLEDWPYNDSKWRDTGRFISGDARSIDAERLRSNDPRSEWQSGSDQTIHVRAIQCYRLYTSSLFTHKTVNFHT